MFLKSVALKDKELRLRHTGNVQSDSLLVRRNYSFRGYNGD
jgi:hypothetical protein